MAWVVLALSAVAVLAVGLTAARAQQVQLNVPGQAAPAAAPAFSESQIVEEFGWFIGKRVGLTELDFSAPEIAAFLKGVSAAAAGKESPYTLEKIGPLMDEFMQKKQNAYLAKAKTASLAATTDYFKKLEGNKNIVTLPSGLRYEILKQGDGATPEGRYRITAKRGKGQTQYYRALVLDYPNQNDRRRFEQAKKTGRIPSATHIGGQIEIHGVENELMAQTLGCVMLDNAQMIALYERVEPGTPVTIVGALTERNAVAVALSHLGNRGEET